MTEKLDLRKKLPAANPAGPASARIAGVNAAGQLPLPSGTVLNLSPSEKAQLEALNWKEGDPVPNVAQLLAEMQQDVRLPLDPTTPMLPPPRSVDIRDLSPEQQASLRDGVAVMLENDRQLSALQGQHVDTPSSPDINKQIDQLMQGGGGSRFAVPQPPAPQSQTSREPVPATVPVPEVATDANATQSTSVAYPDICTNCNHDPVADPIEVIDADKFDFITMLVSGAPFIKEYELFGGRMFVSFRSLSQRELDTAISQAGCDSRDGLLPTQGEFFRVIQNYEMSLSLCQIRTPGGQVVAFPRSLDAIDVDPPEPTAKFQTKLKDYAPYVMRQIQSASALRLITLLYTRFYTLIRRLEENSLTPDFWQGIAPLT
jgi:hypothetical protein